MSYSDLEIKVVLLPAKEKIAIGEHAICQMDINKSVLFFSVKQWEGSGYTDMHLYFIQDEVKEWKFDESLPSGLYFESDNGMIKVITCDRVKTPGKYYKIIATTDNSLKKVNIIGLLEKYPRPSIEFIEHYIRQYHKNNIIGKVLVKHEWIDNLENIPGVGNYYKLVVSNNIISIVINQNKKTKDSYTEKELLDFASWYSGMEKEKVKKQLDKWVEENL